MRTRRMLALVTGAVLLAVAAGITTAGEAEKPEVDLKEAVKGFKGFLVGDLVKTNDDGIVVLVRAVTLVEGNAAANPGLLVGRETPVRFVTEKDEAGRERPAPWLVQAVKRIGEMPAVALGGLGGNAVVVMNAGQAAHAHAAGGANVTAHRMTMRVNDMNVEFGLDGNEEEAGKAGKPKGPLFTGRVLAGDDGVLILDRVMPGSAPGHTWAAMPTLRFEQAVAGPARAEHAELRALAARQEALQKHAVALEKQLAVLQKQLADADQLAPEKVRDLHEQLQKLHAQRDALIHQVAALGQEVVARRQKIAEVERQAAEDARQRQRNLEAMRRAAIADRVKKPPPPQEPKQTDF